MDAMTHWLAAIGLAAALVLASPFAAPGVVAPAAAEESGELEDPGELARDGVERLLRALEALIHSIPQYELPEINEHGDIIIRRKRQVAPDESDDETLDQTQT